ALTAIARPALAQPGPPLPSAARRYDSGGFLSDRRTLPSKVPFTAATPIFSVALYSSFPSASSFSQPGIALRSCLGSRNASQTFARGAATSYEPSSFIPFSFEAPSFIGGGLGGPLRNLPQDRLRRRSRRSKSPRSNARLV